MRFSIVVTAYNIEQYIKECIDSILTQTYTDPFEVTVIDDGSTDSTGTVLDSYSDPRLRVIHLKENRGISYGRNLGIEESTGDWICVIDGDDYIRPDYLQTFSDIIDSNPGIDLIFMRIFTQNEITGKNGIEFMPDFASHVTDNPYEVFDLYLLCTQTQIVKRSIYRDVKFPVGKLHEDVGTIYRTLEHSKKAYLYDGAPYVYRRRVGSITQTSSRKRNCDLVEMCYEQWLGVKDHVSDRAKKLLAETLRVAVKYCVDTYRRDEQTELAYQLWDKVKSLDDFLKSS